MHEPSQGAPGSAPADNGAGARPPSSTRAMAWRIPLLYLLFGTAWVLASDRVVALLGAGDAQTMARFQAWKGGLFMGVTALLLYLLLRVVVARQLESERRTRESEARYRLLFDDNPNPMWTYEVDTLRIVDANQAASGFLGWSRGELRGMDMAVLWPPEHHGLFLEAVRSARDNPGQPQTTTVRLRLNDGRVRDVELRSTEVAGGAQRVRLVVLTDRTAEMDSQRAREEALARLQEAQRLARLGSWEVDTVTLQGRFCPIMLGLVGQAPNARPRGLGEVLVAADADSQARLERLLADTAAGRDRELDVLLPFTGPGGQERLLRVRARRVEEDGRVLLRGTAQDVTEEQHTRQLLDEREQQFRELVRILPDGVMILSGGHVFYANPACGGLFGRQPEALLGEPLSALVAPEDLEPLRAWLEGGAEPPGGAAHMRRADGTLFPASLSRAAARYGGKACTLLLVRDLSEPERMRDALAAGNRELQAMARRLFTAQEDERRAISRELHDDVGQAITAMKLSAHAAMAEDDDGRRRESLEDISATADATLDKLRNLSMLLRPPQLDALGLEAALRWHAGVLFRNLPVLLETDIQPLPRRPEREVEQACFRIAQEALTNAVRHAGASRIALSLRDDDGRGLLLQVEDDGCGFQAGPARGLGLVIMRERAQSAGGQVSIESRPGHGTRVCLRLPYTLQAAA